jgi:acetyltransferase-like isoleucine patch superfamily enzyme
MAFLSEDALQTMGFAALGRNVKVSDKASIYNPDQIRIGDNSRIDDFCVISGKVELGRNVHIAALCLVAGGRPGITMADFSGLAYGVKIFAQSDDYSGTTMTNPTVPAQYKSEILAPLIIGRHVIVGTNSVVGPGVTLAEGSSIGSGAVVLHSTEPWGIYVGVPARRIRERSRKLLELERVYLDSEALENNL